MTFLKSALCSSYFQIIHGFEPKRTFKTLRKNCILVRFFAHSLTLSQF